MSTNIDNIIAVNGIRRIEQHRFKVLFDVADFGGILFHAVKDKFNVTAVELHKLCLDKLCRVIVPGDTDCLSLAAYRFKDNRNNFVQTVFVYLPVAYKMVLLDIVLDYFLINAVCVCRFLSFPFRRLCRFPVVRQGI